MTAGYPVLVLVWKTRPSGWKRTHLTVPAGATAVMLTVVVSASESTQRKWGPTAISPPKGPIAWVTESYVCEHATRPVDVVLLPLSCDVRLARAPRFDRVGGAVGGAVGELSQANAMAATTSPTTDARMRLMTYSCRAWGRTDREYSWTS